MQRSRLTQWGRVLLTAVNLFILAILAGSYYHTAWSQSQAGQEPSSTPTLSRGAEVMCCDTSGCDDRCIPAFLTDDVIRILPEWGESAKIYIPQHEHRDSIC